MGVEMDTGLVDTVLERSGHAWMLEHATMFDEHWITEQQQTLGRWGSAGAATACNKVTPGGAFQTLLTPYTLHSTLHTPHSTLHTPRSTLHTPRSTLHMEDLSFAKRPTVRS
jgi:hypothetical protein